MIATWHKSSETPLSTLVPGMAAWYTAYNPNYMTVNSDGTGGTPAIGGTVGRLLDRAGSYDLIQSTSGNRPVAEPGYLAFSHKGGGSIKFMDTADASYGGTEQSATGLLIIDCAAIPSDSIPLTYTLSMTSPYVWPAQRCSLAWRAKAAGFEIWVNGTQFTAGALTTNPLAALHLGATVAHDTLLSRFYEMALYTTALSDADFAALRSYGMRKSGADIVNSDILVSRGDSRTFGSTSIAVSPWINLTTAMPYAQHYNEGVGGDTIIGSAVPTSTLLSKYPIVGTNCLGVFIGRNDIDAVGSVAADVYAALETYCTTMYNAGWRVVVATEVDLVDEVNENAYNALIQAGALGHFAHAIADLSARSELSDSTNTTYFSDGTHLTDAGNAVVAEVMSAAIELAIAGPNPDFTVNAQSGVAPFTATFTDTSTDSPTSWLWDFGDGNTSTSQNPSHEFTNVGTYTVKLTATNADGSHFIEKTNYISATAALAPPAANKVFWFKKGDATTTLWTDSSGNGRDMTLFNTPTVNASGSITLNGTAQYGKTSAFTWNQPCTVYMRVKPISWTASDYYSDGNTDNSFVLAQTGTTPQVGVYSGGGFYASNGDLAVGVMASVAFGRKTTGTDLFIHVSGGTETSSAATGAAAGGFTLGRLGATSSRFGNFEVLEIIGYADAHDTTQRAEAFAYLDSL